MDDEEDKRMFSDKSIPLFQAGLPTTKVQEFPISNEPSYIETLGSADDSLPFSKETEK